MPETENPDTNVYDMRVVPHEEGWLYGLFCTERKGPNAAQLDTSATVAQCGLSRHSPSGLSRRGAARV